MRRTPRLHAKPSRALPLSLAAAIEARIDDHTPPNQARAERGILAALVAEYGEALEERCWGESETARAIAIVREWRMG